MITKNLQKVFKKGSFIYEYLEYCKDIETSQDFDFWGAIWIVSMLINRQIMINRPNDPLYPNFYITFIDEGNNARRLKAQSLADSTLTNLIDVKDEINFITSAITLNKLNHLLERVSNLCNNSVFSLSSQEFFTLFDNKTIISYFNTLYDCPEERKGYGTNNINIRNVFISSLTASTLNNYFKAVGKDDIEDGFISKNIIIFGNKRKKRIAWSDDLGRYDKTIKAANLLKGSISKFGKFINLSPEAIKRYSKWYIKRRISSKFYNKLFECREHDTVLKLATIIAINNGDKEINLQSLDDAIDLMKYYKLKAIKFLNRELVEEDQITKTINKIRNIIHEKAENGIKHRDLYLRIHNSCSIDDYTYIINVMHELNMIDILQPYGSKTYIYRETPNLMKANINKIIEKLS